METPTVPNLTPEALALLALERDHQKEKGYTLERDEQHQGRFIVEAAISFALLGIGGDLTEAYLRWPWANVSEALGLDAESDLIKAKSSLSEREALVRAGAMILARLEMILWKGGEWKSPVPEPAGQQGGILPDGEDVNLPYRSTANGPGAPAEFVIDSPQETVSYSTGTYFGDGYTTYQQSPVGEVPQVGREAAENRTPSQCPTCGSPRPSAHPALQFEGEVHPCSDPWHALPLPSRCGCHREALDSEVRLRCFLRAGHEGSCDFGV